MEVTQETVDCKDRKEYRLAEYTALMGKLDRATRDLHISEVTFAAAIGIFYAWFLKDGAVVFTTERWILAIPFVLSILGVSRMFARFTYIGRIESYVRAVEEEMFGNQNPSGWEQQYVKESGRTYVNFRIGTWVVIVAVTAYILIFAPLPGNN